MAVQDKITEIIVEQLGVKPEEVTTEASFVDDLGADSLDTVELVMASSSGISTSNSLKEVLRQGDNYDAKIIFWENETNALKPDKFLIKKQAIRSVMIVLGPEGGFTQEEIAEAISRGFVSVGLGPRIMKADTATVAACTLIQYLFGDMG